MSHLDLRQAAALLGTSRGRQRHALRGIGLGAAGQQNQSTQVSVPVTVYATGGAVEGSANVGSQGGATIAAARGLVGPGLAGVAAAAVLLGIWKAATR